MTLGFDPRATIAIVLGAQNYPGLHDYVSSEAFANSAGDFREYLLNDLRITSSNIKWLFESDLNSHEIVEQIERFLADSAERHPPVKDLLVYYVGHGAFSKDRYFLALKSTVASDPFYTGLPMERLARLLDQGAGNLRRFILLDCCFAAAATSEFMAPGHDIIERASIDTFPRQGTALLCASSSTKPAKVGAHYTKFSGALLKILRDDGVPGHGEQLDLASVNKGIRRILEQDGVGPSEVHVPDQAHGVLSKFPLFPNPAANLSDLVAKISGLRQEIEHLHRNQRYHEALSDKDDVGDQVEPIANARPHPSRAEKFSHWMGASPTRYLGISAIALLAMALVLIPMTLGTGRVTPNFELFVLAFQAFVVGLLLFAIPKPIVDDGVATRATVSVHQFHWTWRALWTSWFVLYVLLAIMEAMILFHLYVEPYQPGWLVGSTEQLLYFAGFSSLGNSANNLTTVCIFILYLILSEKTTVTEHNGSVKAARLPWRIGVAVTLLLAVMEFTQFALLTLTNAQYENTADALRYANTIKSQVAEIESTFRWISGLLAGLAIALFVGRLDSKFVGLSPWVIGLLYSYAVIQPGWASFSDKPIFGLAALNTALFLKCLLFVIVTWLLRTGLLLFYLDRISAIDEGVVDDRARFLAKLRANRT